MVAQNTGAARNTAANATPASDQDGKTNETNPVVTQGNNLPVKGTLAENPLNDPASGTGFHCSMCGQSVGAEGQHYNADNDEVLTPHGFAPIVADNWPELAEENDRLAAADQAERRAEKAKQDQ